MRWQLWQQNSCPSIVLPQRFSGLLSLPRALVRAQPHGTGGERAAMSLQNEVTEAHVCKSQEESIQSAEVLSVMLASKGVRARSIHEQLDGLSLSTIYCLLAALMQCLSLASLCVAVSLLKWVAVVQYPYTRQPKRWVTYNFGVPDVMEVYETQQPNGTDIPEVHFFPNTAFVPWFISICFVGMFLGFAAFLLDFMEIEILGKHKTAVATSLHILSGIFLVILIGICCWCFVTVNERIYRDDLMNAELLSFLGESFYITLLSLAFASLASTLSFLAMKLSRQE
ncbi:Hypothetical predicted protein [Podarcis lilfordi]|uniref:Uncharacterized protein n=2 Tax=Podarcis lilfordi TaxID=74358 RepID=A0AA35KWK1_9SAUR|nr:Hypothetical predicted protein [Podarcis lilfordi]